MAEDGRGRHDGELARGPAMPVIEDRAQGGEALDERLGQPHEQPAVVRERDAFPLGGYELHAELLLQRAHLLPHGGHRQAQRDRRARVASARRQLHQRAELAEAHFLEVAARAGGGSGSFWH